MGSWTERDASSYVQVRHAQRILLDELSARLDNVAHELDEDIVGLVDLADLDLQKRAGFAVEGSLPQLVLVHLAQALIALESHALAAGGVDSLKQLRGTGGGGRVAAARKGRRLGEGFAERPRMLVEAARVGRSEQARVKRRRLPDAAHLARQHIAVRIEPSAPTPLGLRGNPIHPVREDPRARLALGIVGPAQGPERTGERSLFHEGAIVARVQAIELPTQSARLLDERAKVGTCAGFPIGERQRRAVEPRLDQIILEPPLVLEILLRLAAFDLEQRRLRNEEMSRLDDRAHLPEEESQQQGADVRTVNIRICHDD